jgi:hypothetical protein
MSLAKDMQPGLPESHVLLPSNAYTRVFDRDFTIREIICKSCNTVLCALVIAEEHEADCVWPFDVICEQNTHSLVPKGTEGSAKVVCKGRAAQEWEAKKYLKQYMP